LSTGSAPSPSSVSHVGSNVTAADANMVGVGLGWLARSWAPTLRYRASTPKAVNRGPIGGSWLQHSNDNIPKSMRSSGGGGGVGGNGDVGRGGRAAGSQLNVSLHGSSEEPAIRTCVHQTRTRHAPAPTRHAPKHAPNTHYTLVRTLLTTLFCTLGPTLPHVLALTLPRVLALTRFCIAHACFQPHAPRTLPPTSSCKVKLAPAHSYACAHVLASFAHSCTSRLLTCVVVHRARGLTFEPSGRGRTVNRLASGGRCRRHQQTSDSSSKRHG
jgi:hypothetical protein